MTAGGASVGLIGPRRSPATPFPPLQAQRSRQGGSSLNRRGLDYRSGGGTIGRGAPPTEIGLVGLGARFPMAAGRGGTTGWPEIEFWIGAIGAVAVAFRRASTFAAKSITWSDSVFRSAFWASRLSAPDRKELVICRSKASKSAQLTDCSTLTAVGSVTCGVASTAV